MSKRSIDPMPGPAGINASGPQTIAAGVLQILRGDAEPPAASARWAAVCSGSGHRIQACQHGVNPRFMLTMAQLAMQRRKGDADRRRDAFTRFTGMTSGVRVLSRLQLPPELLSRFGAAGEPEEAPDLVFYTGCNLLKTPHIALLCFDIMDALGIRYRVMGGPSHCCGVLQFRAGDLATSGRVAYRTMERLGSGAGGRVLSWCPTCQVQLGEVVSPRADARLDMQPFLVFLAERLDQLRPLLKHPVCKRVGLHEHPGVAGVTTLAGIYHACHRELCSHERDWPFEVVNFLELVGESMGLVRPDLFKRLKLMQDVDAVLADRASLLDINHVGLDEARDVILADMLGEQPLPLREAAKVE